MVAHCIYADDNDPSSMNVSYAACNGTLKNASMNEQSKQVMQSLIQNTLRSLNLPGGPEQLAKIQDKFTQRAARQL